MNVNFVIRIRCTSQKAYMALEMVNWREAQFKYKEWSELAQLSNENSNNERQNFPHIAS